MEAAALRRVGSDPLMTFVQCSLVALLASFRMTLIPMTLLHGARVTPLPFVVHLLEMMLTHDVIDCRPSNMAPAGKLEVPLRP